MSNNPQERLKQQIKNGQKSGRQRTKGIVRMIVEFSPAVIVSKMMWKPIKLAGKMIWTGIKKLALGVLALFKGIFKIGGKFINKVSNWMIRLASAIKDKTY